MKRVVSLFQHVHTGSLSLFSSRRTNVDCIVRTMDTGRNVLKESQKVEFCKVSVGSKIGGDGEITHRAVCRSRCVINRISLFSAIIKSQFSFDTTLFNKKERKLLPSSGYFVLPLWD